MDARQLLTTSEQIASVLRASISDKAGYILITTQCSDDGDDIHIFANLHPVVMIALFSQIAQDIAGQTPDVTVN